MSSTLTNLTAATTWSGTDLFYALVGGNSRKIAASSMWVCDAANVLSDVNSTTAQTVRIYRTFTDSSNYERLALQTGSGYMELAAETAGTGTDALHIKLTPAGGGAVLVGGAFFTTVAKKCGYYIGAGGAVTQLTSKATAVTTTTPCGQITMHNAALAAGATVKFQVGNGLIETSDVIICHYASGGTTGAYRVDVARVVDGALFDLNVTNITAGSLSEAIVLNYAIINGRNS